jgi:hypothetical protein
MADYPRGVRAAVTGGGVDIQHGSQLVMNSELTFEEILDPFNAGLATGVISGTTPKVHTFTPILTADPVPKSLYYEIWKTDGVSNLLASSFSAGLCSNFVINAAFSQITQLTYTMFGRSEVTGITPTAALTPFTNREPVVSNLWKVYFDNTWAGLGGTQKSTLVRSARLTINTGLTPDYTLDGRANLDYTRYNWGNLTGTLDIVMEFDGDANTEKNFWNTQNATGSPQYRFIRLKNSSPNGSPGKYIQIDGSYIYAKEPVFSHEANTNVELATMSLALEYDPTSAKVFLPVVANSITAYT